MRIINDACLFNLQFFLSAIRKSALATSSNIFIDLSIFVPLLSIHGVYNLDIGFERVFLNYCKLYH